MSERPKEHDWKSCVPPQSGTEGSNPSLSVFCAMLLLLDTEVSMDVIPKAAFTRSLRKKK